MKGLLKVYLGLLMVILNLLKVFGVSLERFLKIRSQNCALFVLLIAAPLYHSLILIFKSNFYVLTKTHRRQKEALTKLI